MATRAQLPHLSIAINSLVTMRIYVQCNLAMKVYISVKKLYKLYKHDHLEGLYPLQSKICRSPNQTVQWELPWCSDISSQFITYVIKYVQCVFSVSIGPRPELAKSPMDLDCEPGTCTDSTDTDCTCKFWCRLWTMWTMWTWVNSDVYGLFMACLTDVYGLYGVICQ
jgi:hypothetical protein